MSKRKRELKNVEKVIEELGFSLVENQPHIKGERYLMQALTTPSGKKYILVGTQKKNGEKVLIKITDDPNGKEELRHEHACQDALNKIGFAYDVFATPEEIYFGKQGGYLISVHVFIEREHPFLEYSREEQFDFALKAFKAQEGVHATTSKHYRLIKSTFGIKDAKGYLNTFNGFVKTVREKEPILKSAYKFLKDQEDVIEQYCGFLTHIDFVPHNFRVVGKTIYLLDYSSLRFGNKYEGWARFINFMELYSPTLAHWLIQYVKENRTEEESFALKAMRVYRLGEIICYYKTTLSKSDGNLYTLNKKRIDFWAEVLKATLADEKLQEKVRETYKKERDHLRSKEEKDRQKELH